MLSAPSSCSNPESPTTPSWHWIPPQLQSQSRSQSQYRPEARPPMHPTLTLATAALPLPRAPVRHAKSNSERGKEFRARRKMFEAELIASVHSLRRDIAELDRQRSLWSDVQRPIVRRNSGYGGSLTTLMHEYFRLFRFGFCKNQRPPSPLPMQAFDAKRHLLEDGGGADPRIQESFVRHTMDESFQVGNEFGPEASLEQWQRYTRAFEDNWCEVQSITAEGSEEEPIVTVRMQLHARICPNTFRIMFPRAVYHPELMDKFMNQEVVFEIAHTSIFNREGKITREIAKLDSVGAFMNVGISFMDIASLMQFSVASSDGVLPAPDQVETPPVQACQYKLPSLSTQFNMKNLLKPTQDVTVEQRHQERHPILEVEPTNLRHCRARYERQSPPSRSVFT